MSETIPEHYTESRPWGSFTVLDEGVGYKVKKIIVYPKQRLSLQYHHKRAEQWVVASGTALITVGEDTKSYSAGEAAHIPLGMIHRIENQGNTDVVFFEVQNGEYLGEDDIVRLEDDYNR